MLTKIPKMGDVIIAKDCDEIYFMGDMTPGKEYLVTGLDSDGDAIIMDDVFDDRSIYGIRKESFTPKVVEPVGLREVPKVGDVIIAINSDRGRGGIADITKGKEYIITKVTGTSAWYRDDSGFERIASESRLRYFTLKGAVSPDKVGHIEVIPKGNHLGEGRTRLTVIVDDDGLSTLRSLQDKSTQERKKASITDKIAQCQAEMDSLNALLAEVSE